jgi:uncharacterized membrane protein
MAATILGVFDDPAAARQAMDDLQASSLDLDDVSIISPSGEQAMAVGGEEHMGAGEGAALGAVWGGLVGLASLLIPGVGPFVAGGALFAALTGAATGAVIGGVAGALMDSAGLPEKEARDYETMVHSGKTLVAVKVRDEDSMEVRRILAHAGANSVRDNQTDLASSSAPVHVAAYGEGGQSVNQELEYGAAGTRAASGMPAAGVAAGLQGFNEMPQAPAAGEGRASYDTPTMTDTNRDLHGTREVTNAAAGTEDPYGTRQVPPGDEGRAIETRGWDRVGYAGDRQGESLTPPEPGEIDPNDAARRPQ